MSTDILIIAHKPLAGALKAAAVHVFPEAASGICVLDVPADESVESTQSAASELLSTMPGNSTLVLTDVFGATPCNIAQKIVDGVHSRLVAGVNLPMLLRTVNYRHEPLELLIARAIAGGTQSIMQVAITAPQNQQRKKNDLYQHDHSQ